MDVPKDAPVYSSYTNALIGYGPQLKGQTTDAPVGHDKHGEKFHGLTFCPEKGEKGEFTLHRYVGYK